jgi:predicted GIY-YIG superfamily endonuclease
MYLVYIIQSNNRSYIGMTNNFLRRWMQHNKILKGGAKYTSKYEHWTPICIVDGFQTKSEAMQCEWKLKRAKGYYNRLKNLSHLLQHSEKWTSKSPEIQSQQLDIYVTEQYKSLFPMKTNELVWF